MAHDEPLPSTFRFGVATAGYQVEGGFNGPGEPRNNWYRFENEGRVEPSGNAIDFWERYPEHLDRAAAAGCDAIRIGVEWARCEPEEGSYDDSAFVRYRDILVACRELGLEPLVTLHHFTHPWWLGEELWLDLDAPHRFATWARDAVSRLGAHCNRWVTVNEPNILALQTWFTGDFPPARRLAVGDVTRAFDHLLTAHVLGYGAIHDVQPEAVVATNLFTFSLYELERLATDTLSARLHGISPVELRPWLAGRRDEHRARVVPLAGPERLLRRWAEASVDLDQALPRTAAAVFDSPHECTLDVSQVDHYNPFTASHLRVPGRATSGGRTWNPGGLLWEDRPDPAGFAAFSELALVPGRDLWVVENGLCNRVLRGVSHQRDDGWTRPRYIAAHMRAVLDLLDRGVPVSAYFHWSLADNYEWGSYEPRFGLYGVDRARGNRWSSTDAMGHDAAGAYRTIIEGLRAGDRSVLDREWP
jgi:beta-glucosidase/6-phospho-beta-glucosidase/beta-galactosidase